MKNIVLYPGSFDPLTNGHKDIIERAADVFDEVIVAIGVNSNKAALFSLEQRVEMAESVFAKEDNIQVTAFDALSTDFALECGANIILRGLRTGIDFAAEFQLDWMNQRLAPELETLFMTPSEEVAGISSTLVKEVAKYGGDYEQFVPAVVAQALEDAFA
jgi:pantetheine-phosphate adenylyltransferase